MILIVKEESIIIGVDILPQTSPSRKNYFAVCVYDVKQDKVLMEFDRVNIHKLLGITTSAKAHLLATDNIYELVLSPSQIPFLCIQLLPVTKLVQVTGSPIHGFTPLSKLIRDHGMKISGKLTPLSAAKACAFLASKNLGYIIEPFEDETRIIVSRTRSKGAGGWSQARYSRLMDTSVNQEAKKVEIILKDQNFDYDKNTAKSKYGAQKVIFNVYAPFNEVTKVIKKQKGEICRINVVPVNKERVEFIPLSQEVTEKSKLKRLIVGIDPGLTVGLSILDLKGRIVKIASFREVSRGQIIREITRYGKPTIICCDVYPYPSYVEKIAATLSARIYAPKSVMTVAEKNVMSRTLALQQGITVKNAHQRDSFAAAYSGYKKYRSEFDKIDKRFFYDFNQSLRDEIKDMIVKGSSISEAEQSIKKELFEERAPIKAPPDIKIIKKEPTEAQADSLLQKINLLEELLDFERRKNTEFYSENKELEIKIEYLQEKLEEGKTDYFKQIYREKIIRQKDNLISSYSEKMRLLEREMEFFADRIEELKRVAWLRGNEGWTPLKVIRKFSQDEIMKTEKTYGLGPGDSVYILDTTGGGGQTVELLLSYKIKAVIGNIDQFSYYAKEKLVELNVPMADSSSVEIIRIDEIAIIKEEDLNNIVTKAEKDLEKIQTKKKKGFLKSLLEEYREERQKEFEEYNELKKQEGRRNDNIDYTRENE